MPKPTVTKIAYIGIFVLAMVAAFFSASVVSNAWEVLFGAIYETLPPLPPICNFIGGYIVFGNTVLPALSAIGTAFAVSYFSFKFLHRYSAIGQNIKGVPLAYALLWPFVFIFCSCSWFAYNVARFPSPEPYSGAIVERIWDNRGGGYISGTYEYTIELPLDEVEEYYVAEMQKYCVAGWKFTEIPTCADYSDYIRCRRAECEISRPLVRWAKDAQFFEVSLDSVSETETHVAYTDTGLDL